VNLPAVGDEGFAGEATARVMGLLDDIQEIAAVVHAGVFNGESREPISG
jgi:hypothetical protein